MGDMGVTGASSRPVDVSIDEGPVSDFTASRVDESPADIFSSTDATAVPSVTLSRRGLSHPLLCRETPDDSSTVSLEGFTQVFDCRLEEIRGHIEAGRLDRAGQMIRELHASWRSFNAAHREIPQRDRSALLGRLYLAQSSLEAGRGETRRLWRVHYEARGYDLTGDHARARLLYREFMGMPVATPTAELVAMGRVSIERRRALEIEAIERLREENHVLTEERSAQLGPSFPHERTERLNELLLDHLESYLESGEARRVDEALEFYRRDWEGAALSYEDLPRDAAERQRLQADLGRVGEDFLRRFREDPSADDDTIRTVRVRGGWTLRVPSSAMERRASYEAVRVVIPREGGAIAVEGDLTYVFPPASHDRVVAIRRGSLVCPHLREGADYYRDTAVAAPADPALENLQERDEQFAFLLQMETTDGLERLANPDPGFGRNHYLFVNGMTLLGPQGSYELAAPMFREIFDPELVRAREEAGSTGDPEADERRAMELLNRWYESGELAGRDSTAARAWHQYVLLENPLQEWNTVTYEEQDMIMQNLLVFALSGPFFEMVAPEAGATAGASIVTRIGLALRTGLAQGAIMTGVRSVIDQEVHPTQAVSDTLMCGAFNVAGEVTGPVLGSALARTGAGRVVTDWFSEGPIRSFLGGRAWHLTNGLGVGTVLTYANPWDNRSFLARFLDNAGGMAVMSAMHAGGAGVAGEDGRTTTAPEGVESVIVAEEPGQSPTPSAADDRSTLRPGVERRPRGDVDLDAAMRALDAHAAAADAEVSALRGRLEDLDAELSGLDLDATSRFLAEMDAWHARSSEVDGRTEAFRGWLERIRADVSALRGRVSDVESGIRDAESRSDRGRAASFRIQLLGEVATRFEELSNDWRETRDQARTRSRHRTLTDLFPVESAVVDAQRILGTDRGALWLLRPESLDSGVEISVPDTAAEGLVIDRIAAQEGVTVEISGNGDYQMTLEDGRSFDLRFRRGLDLPAERIADFAAWLDEQPREISEQGDDLRSYDSGSLERLVDHLVSRGWSNADLTTLFGRSEMVDQLGDIMNRRVVREGRSESEGL